ncbi:putative outer membrane starch-binding protein [Neolewinella xylanilytica]|uniref:Putative outer membrane starch-binding protein n=1 Tax=Neolewinella xylanilytica TaxID=1514080 RepID=A0A2S6I8D6_9BACT|nr:RagB/SusD family nutrient uptake outer membrane protein [Neolewinella xylanilytica]PPK87742.1 putative outer membrane starch-binding protein [Neolewinella xylanilytica]
MKLYKFFPALLPVLLVSCTDLEPEIYSDLTPETQFTSDDAVLGALLQNYTNLNLYVNDAIWPSQELSTETSAAPAKFGPWDDGGVWARLHRHEWESTFFVFNNSWNLGFSGIAACNRTIDELSELGGSEEAIIEMRSLRALYYWLMIDLFGDVPLETSFLQGTPNPERAPRAEVYQFIVSELNDVLDSGMLSDASGGAYYGRMTRWGALALLTKVYLNAETYTGTPQWEMAAATASRIIDDGPYVLEENYFDNFEPENRTSRENIFVIPYEKSGGNTGFNMHMRTLHPLNRETYNFTTGPWNGFVALEEFYNTFDETDSRKEMFIVGQQYDAAGNPLLDPNGETEVDSDGNPEPDGAPLIFTPEINELTPRAFSQSGARIGKFAFDFGLALAQQNDFPIFRYADILLMRAEALWRMDNGDAEAVELVRQVRERAGLEAIDPLTEDELYDEIQRELAFEAHSRPTMIRFDRFTGNWWEKNASSEEKLLFPIPQGQLNANPNLTQNPGY